MSLVELLVVIGIVMLLMSIILPAAFKLYRVVESFKHGH
jgi:type II secretory pathway pseudopilin PulG